MREIAPHKSSGNTACDSLETELRGVNIFSLRQLEVEGMRFQYPPLDQASRALQVTAQVSAIAVESTRQAVALVLRKTATPKKRTQPNVQRVGLCNHQDSPTRLNQAPKSMGLDHSRKIASQTRLLSGICLPESLLRRGFSFLSVPQPRSTVNSTISSGYLSMTVRFDLRSTISVKYR